MALTKLALVGILDFKCDSPCIYSSHCVILNENKLLKKLIKRKKEDYKLGIIKDMNLNKGDKKLFWKLLDKLQTENKDI